MAEDLPRRLTKSFDARHFHEKPSNAYQPISALRVLAKLRGVAMHIHGMPNQLDSAYLYSNAGAEKAAEAHRVADTRKRLLKAAQSASTEESPEETLFIGHWMESRHSKVLSPEQQYAANSGKDEDFFG